MKPQLTISEDSLTLEIYGGYGEIGGNCVLVKDRDRKIVFDNGIRFQVLRKYYRGRIQPLGINELRSIGAIPPLNIFEDIDAIYISHFHLDHLGLLGALPPGVKVYVPSIDILEVIEDWYRRSSTWLAEIPHRLNIKIEEFSAYHMDEHGVIPIPVSHSAYPSYAFLYEGYSKTLFYSGDLRVDSPLRSRIDTLSNIERAIDSMNLDIALLEATNIGGIETPIGSEEFRNIMNRILMENILVIISIDPLDYELFTAISELALLSGRTITIASPRIIDVLPKWLKTSNTNNIDLSRIAIAIELEKPTTVPLQYVGLKQDVFRTPENFLLIQEPVSFLEMLRQMRLWGEELPRNAIAILTTPEPLETELEVEEKTLITWLYTLGIQIYRARFSGHYYPHELRNIVDILKPKKLIPIHTKHPRLVYTVVQQMLEQSR